MPLTLPTNTRPAATVGCPDADVVLGKPKAHFNVSFGTWAAVNPADLAFWNRELELSLPQPFHIGIDAGSGRAPPALHMPALGSLAAGAAPAAALPDSMVARPCFSAADRPSALAAITPP